MGRLNMPRYRPDYENMTAEQIGRHIRDLRELGMSYGQARNALRAAERQEAALREMTEEQLVEHIAALQAKGAARTRAMLELSARNQQPERPWRCPVCGGPDPGSHSSCASTGYEGL